MQAFHEGDPNRAIAILKIVLQEDAINSDSIFQLGLACAQNNRISEALIIFECLLPYKNSDARIPYNLGLLYSMQGNYQSALDAYDLALEINPGDVESLVNIGSAYNDVKNYAAALDALQCALQIKSDIPEAWSNKGIALNNLKRHEESVDSYGEAIKLNPGYFEAWSNQSVPLNILRRHSEALEACDRAISLRPDYAEAWLNKGNTLNELRHHDEALILYDKAISLRPDYAEAWLNKGVSLNQLKRYDEALLHYRKALRLKPEFNWVYGNLLHLKMKICSWDDGQESVGSLIYQVQSHSKVTLPFPLLALVDDSSLHRQCAEIYIKDEYPLNPGPGVIARRPKKSKIRIAYFSADFKSHPVALLTAGLFELHDRSRFEVYAFSVNPHPTDDEIRGRLKKAFDQFIDVGTESDLEIAQLAREMEIDIAIDLGGHTEFAPIGVMSYRAAPIQVNYLGYPGTLGADYIDYIIADKTLIPTGSQQYYSEKVVYLPNSYQVNDRKRVIPDQEFTRQELGLPEKGFVFCCFNNNFKILPATFDGWMRILKAVEGSTLWLFEDNASAALNLRQEAENRGIDASRLVFAKHKSPSEHIARHRQADLFIDTLPYNAHTTASDALWAGLPVLTCMGQSFASRVAASLLNAIDLPELITTTQMDYEARAIELGNNPDKVAILKQALANKRLTTALFDTSLFTRHLEAAYGQMMDRYQADLVPDHIYIANSWSLRNY